MFEAEKVTSVSDFGTGVGQYGYYLKTNIPDLIYYGYDGASNVKSFTHGFVRYADFTHSLDFPIIKWVLSLDVGEHIPSKYEGMFIQNLHCHNCNSIILSWGILGQVGGNHINLQTNEYIEKIFQEIGYDRDLIIEGDLQNCENNHKFFANSAMVYRRKTPTLSKWKQKQKFMMFMQLLDSEKKEGAPLYGYCKSCMTENLSSRWSL